jgi:hypothetical protein
VVRPNRSHRLRRLHAE